ncbi:hypothetical protein NPIL_26171 [Nephila pilipes]|uniref:Uncharacterized protein n=1 Tax=Nephila pilipes TaxID=299642 RepID=A0A8X6URV2_NEPPI|nr:hypothetical protein NPIL_26171 [Nephila pilipes]
MTTGHDYLQKYLQQICVKDSACCPLCHHGDTGGDYLKNCPDILKFLAEVLLRLMKDFTLVFISVHRYTWLKWMRFGYNGRQDFMGKQNVYLNFECIASGKIHI